MNYLSIYQLIKEIIKKLIICSNNQILMKSTLMTYVIALDLPIYGTPKMVNGFLKKLFLNNPMGKIRLIGRLDIKGPNLIKGVRFEGLRILGSPEEYAINYYNQGIDELIYIDTVASLYGRNNLLEFVKKVVKKTFIPITVGGGIRSVDDAKRFLNAGADKVAINTAAVQNPKILEDIAKRFGSQCLVLIADAKKQKKKNGNFTRFKDVKERILIFLNGLNKELIMVWVKY